MFNIVKPDTNFDFVGKRFLWMGLSVVAIVGTIVLFFTKGLNYGIDFTGGAEVQIDLGCQGGADRGDAIKGDGGERAVPFGHQRKEPRRFRLASDPGHVR